MPSQINEQQEPIFATAGLADYHTHTPLCKHAEGWPVELVRRAEELQLAEIGISDHNPMPEKFDDWRMDLEELPLYLEAVAHAREKARIPVRLGLECDFLPGQETWIEDLSKEADWDYLIGSVHYVLPGWDVDNPAKLSEWTRYSVDDVWQIYFETFEKAIRSGLFDFMAHPDLVKKFGRRPEGDLRWFYEGCIAAAAEVGALFELSTAGLRKDCRELYPSRDFLQMACDAGIGIVINSDAHAPLEVGKDYDAAVALAKEVGYDGVWFFEGRERLFKPFLK